MKQSGYHATPILWSTNGEIIPCFLSNPSNIQSGYFGGGETVGGVREVVKPKLVKPLAFPNSNISHFVLFFVTQTYTNRELIQFTKSTPKENKC